MRDAKSILSLDLGTTTGWAILRKTGEIFSGSENFKGSRYEGGGMRFVRFSRWLDEAVHGIDLIYFEEVRRHKGVDAAHIYGGLMACLMSACEIRGIPCEGIPVGTIKKHVTGNGNASKALVIAAMERLGHSPADDNEADALALLRHAMDRNKIASSQ